jgi:hypothetical protein
VIQVIDNITWLNEIESAAQSRLIDTPHPKITAAATEVVVVVIAIDCFHLHDRLSGRVGLACCLASRLPVEEKLRPKHKLLS